MNRNEAVKTELDGGITDTLINKQDANSLNARVESERDSLRQVP